MSALVIADITAVRVTPDSGHSPVQVRCPLSAKNRHWLPVDAATRRAEEADQRRQGEEFVPEEKPVALPDLNVGSRRVRH